MSQQVFTDSRLAELIRLREIPPAMLGWNRLEGRPRRRDFDRSLRAEVRDPLWFLTRQWQLGEFVANDGGSPSLARVEIETTRLDLFAPRSGAAATIDDQLPLEAVVERESVPLDLGLRIRLGQQWLALLGTASLIGSYRNDYLSTYPIQAPPRDEANASVHAHSEPAQWYAAAAGRAIDGGELLGHLLRGGDAAAGIAIVDPLDAPKLTQAGLDFIAWYKGLYSEAEAGAGFCWSPSYLEYQFRASAPAAGGQDMLIAEEYNGDHLDWYNFEWASGASSLLRPAGAPSPVPPTRQMLEFLPAPVVFGGMPNARWWEFEDRNIDFGRIDAATTDVAKLLLIEFGLIYSNDWFVLPYPLATGSLARVTGLTITNVFGERFLSNAAGSGADDDWQRWSLFNLSVVGEGGAARTDLLLPATAARLQEGEPLEIVHLVRDEMANMVWGVESRITLPHGGTIEGAEAARAALDYARSLYPPPPTPPPTPSQARIRYILSTSVPEHYIPFVPVHVDGSNREVQLQRGALLRIIEGRLPHPPVEPQTALLRTGLSEGLSYFIHEEEVPRAGRKVTRSFQRARWHNGRVILWLGRESRTGRGETSSGLAYDRIRPIPEEEP